MQSEICSESSRLTGRERLIDMDMKDDVSQVELCSNYKLASATTERKAIDARSDGLCTDVNDGAEAHDIHTQTPVKRQPQKRESFRQIVSEADPEEPPISIPAYCTK